MAIPISHPQCWPLPGPIPSLGIPVLWVLEAGLFWPLLLNFSKAPPKPTVFNIELITSFSVPWKARLSTTAPDLPTWSSPFVVPRCSRTGLSREGGLGRKLPTQVSLREHPLSGTWLRVTQPPGLEGCTVPMPGHSLPRGAQPCGSQQGSPGFLSAPSLSTSIAKAP